MSWNFFIVLFPSKYFLLQKFWVKYLVESNIFSQCFVATLKMTIFVRKRKKYMNTRDTLCSERVVHGGSLYGEFFFNFVFAATATTIISGALAERVEFGSYLIYGIIATGFIQPVTVHWAWSNGWLVYPPESLKPENRKCSKNPNSGQKENFFSAKSFLRKILIWSKILGHKSKFSHG